MFLVHKHTYIRLCGSTLYVGLQHAVLPTKSKCRPLLLPTQTGITYTNTHKHRISYFKSTLTFLGPAKCWKCLSAARKKPGNSSDFYNIIVIIRECGSTLYVGLAHTAPHTNTTFRITFQLTRLLEVTYLYRASNLKSTSLFWPFFYGSQFLVLVKDHCFLRFIYNIKYYIIIVHFFRRVCSECTEAIATSLIPLNTILAEICAFLAVLCGLK